MRDQYAPDGIISCGERRVRKGGRIFFGGHVAQHEKLIHWVGKNVFAIVDDYFFLNVNISDADNYTRFICQAPVECRKKPEK